MSHEHHTWHLGKVPPFIRPHSLAKHKVLRAYLERYVSVLTANPRQDRLRLTLVDGFAGGGRYLDSRTKAERPGSPLVILDAIRSAEAAARGTRTKPFHLDAHFFFIETNAESLEYLRRTIADSEHRDRLKSSIDLVHGDFVLQVPKIIEFVRSHGRAGRTIFFLDQFGYTDVPLPRFEAFLASWTTRR